MNEFIEMVDNLWSMRSLMDFGRAEADEIQLKSHFILRNRFDTFTQRHTASRLRRSRRLWQAEPVGILTCSATLHAEVYLHGSVITSRLWLICPQSRAWLHWT